MTPELIKQWTEQAAAYASDKVIRIHPEWQGYRDQHFAALVAAHQRELDAQIVEKWAGEAPFVEEMYAGLDCAAAIRGRGE